MTGTENRDAQGIANSFSASPARSPSRTRISALLAIAAFLAIVASFLPGVPAAQAQTPGSTRLELVTVSDGTAYHKRSDKAAPRGLFGPLWSAAGRSSGIP